MTINALTKQPVDGPKFDLVGPTVDDDIHRIIGRYGAEAVKEAIKRQINPQRGRKQAKDWPELGPMLKQDARDLLAGGDPFYSRSNYSIAKDFADKNPGHSHPSTMKRIERKLLKRRKSTTLLIAENIGREGYPYANYIRVLDALTALNFHPVWASIRDRAKADIADYEAKKGEVPPAHMSMKEVEDATRNSLLTLGSLAAPKKSGGMFGQLSNYALTSDKQD